jgi:hypothetical protein
LPGESWRETLAAEGAPMEAMFRVSNEDNFFDDYINPAAWIGSMAKALGEAPLQAKKTDSYLPYVTSIGMPLIGGAAAGMGAKNTRQFVNNVVNPLAGVNPLKSKQLPGSPNAVSSVDDVGKDFGLSIDELNTKGIIKKSKDLEKNVDLGIGRFNHNNLVEYDNGLQLHTYSKPGSSVDDVILMYNPKTNENIAYMRKYKLGDDWKQVPTNEWHIKADMPTTDKELVKFANKELEKIAPVKPIKYEDKTISTDGLRYWNQQTKYGYSPLDDITKPYVSAAGKNDLFTGLRYSNNDDSFEALKFATKKDATEGAKRLEDFIKKSGNDYKVIISNDNSLQINLPKLQRAFGKGGSIPKFQNTLFKDGGEIISSYNFDNIKKNIKLDLKNRSKFFAQNEIKLNNEQYK